jgi:hypothetical protein
LYGAGTGGVIGGMSSAMSGGNFWDGAVLGAALGAIGGGFAGGQKALSNGQNAWWGSKIAHNRTRWSFAWWDAPDVYTSPIPNVAGEIENGCVPGGLNAISDSYGQSDETQAYWKAQYEECSGEQFNGVHEENICDYTQSNGYCSEVVKSDDLASCLQSGKRVGVAVSNYGLNNSEHWLDLQALKIWPNGKMQLILMNPDGGGTFTLGSSYFKTYNPRFYSIFQ